jgi:acyl-CoA thioester hydrolase
VDERTAHVFFFAPFVSSTMQVEPAWIDYNGHMNMAYFHVLLDNALEEAFTQAGLGHDYLDERGASFFTAEVHTGYKRELRLNDRVRVTVQLIDFDEKRLHYYVEIRHAEDGWVAATFEGLSLHIDMSTRKTCPFPDDIRDNLFVMRAAHSRLRRPNDLGRVIGMPSRTERLERLVSTGTRH